MRRLAVAISTLVALLFVVVATDAVAAVDERYVLEAGDHVLAEATGRSGSIDIRRDVSEVSVVVGADVRVLARRKDDSSSTTVLVKGGSTPAKQVMLVYGEELSLTYKRWVDAAEAWVSVSTTSTTEDTTTTTTAEETTTTSEDSPTTTEATTTTRPSGAAGSGWVPVSDAPDPSRFDAPTPYRLPEKTASTSFANLGFSVDCDPTHRAKDDPIVYPGQPGASHLHEFFGSIGIDADTTAESLINTDTTCTSSDDQSGYWFPALYDNGALVKVHSATFYYKPSLLDKDTRPFPLGFRMIAGNYPDSTTAPDELVAWFQEHRNATNHTTSDSTRMITANKTGMITARIVFPSCWDGKHLDSPDHRSHVAYRKNRRTCPESFPVPIPQLLTFVNYRSDGGSGISLASGPWYTMHADFFNAWHPDTQQQLIDECVNSKWHCKEVIDR